MGNSRTLKPERIAFRGISRWMGKPGFFRRSFLMTDNFWIRKPEVASWILFLVKKLTKIPMNRENRRRLGGRSARPPDIKREPMRISALFRFNSLVKRGIISGS